MDASDKRSYRHEHRTGAPGEPAPPRAGAADFAAKEFRYKTLLKLQDGLEALGLALAAPTTFRAWLVGRPATWEARRCGSATCPLAQYARELLAAPDTWGVYVGLDAVSIFPGVDVFDGQSVRVRVPRWARDFLRAFDGSGSSARLVSRADVLAVYDTVMEAGHARARR